MTPTEYQLACERTESKPCDEAWVFRTTPLMRRLMHGAIGCGTESGELLDAIKKYIWYGKDLDGVKARYEHNWMDGEAVQYDRG